MGTPPCWHLACGFSLSRCRSVQAHVQRRHENAVQGTSAPGWQEVPERLESYRVSRTRGLDEIGGYRVVHQRFAVAAPAYAFIAGRL
jgi:hypothetical protein